VEEVKVNKGQFEQLMAQIDEIRKAVNRMDRRLKELQDAQKK
jgi:ubiquinone biosynthesis protein UbiJ